MTQSRRALLLAIAEYDEAGSLDYVRGDIPRMKRALDRMGVPNGNIKVHAPDKTAPQDVLSLARLRKIIRQFLDGAAAGEDLIVYFSGHGGVIEGHRVLIPQDFDPEEPQADMLIADVELLRMARRSEAQSVLFLIDACRDSYSLELKAEGTKGAAPEPALPCDDTPTIAFVHSCALGESSGIDNDQKQCSAFTRAFAEALEAEGDRVRLPDVIADAQARLNGYVAPKVGTQTITLGDQRAHGRRGDPERLAIKQSDTAQFRDRLENSRWVGLLRETRLWTALNEAQPALATQVAAIVLAAEDQVALAADALPQRWRAERAPFRVLDRLDSHLLAGLEPTAAERAVMLAVPFVYELVLATAEQRLIAEGAGLDPLLPEPKDGDSAFRRAWRTAGLNDEAGARIVARLRERGTPDTERAADDVAAWRFNAFCHGAGELWNPMPEGWATSAVAVAARLAPLPEVRNAGGVDELLSAGRLLRFARLMFAPYEDVMLEVTGQTGAPLNRDAWFGGGTPDLALDEVAVVHRLNLSARLALDARRLPGLLAEHLGCDDRLSLDSVQELLDRAAWWDRSPALALGLTCPHEALDAALRESVDDLDAYRRRLCGTRHERSTAGLPGAYTADELRAEEIGPGRPRYDTEHLRFTLEQGKVMGLLMGKELYGDPDLALRELYQNAMDACRYRRAHEQYWRKMAPHRFFGSEYQGRIVFRFGTEGGRRYIECIDNGIGMADRHLRRLFARAGKRFTDSHEYHLDKARWEEASIPFYPNSRFGIGVLSYFMLAEELEVASQRAAEPGKQPAPRVHARVLGSGSLFRIDRDDTTQFDGSGTRVRLYLEDRTRQLVEYRDSILKWLWVPEFETFFIVDGHESKALESRKISDEFQRQKGPLLPISFGASPNCGSRLFWCLGSDIELYGEYNLESAVLIDGIYTEVTNRRNMPQGVAINITEDMWVDISVDRRRIQSVDEIKSLIRQYMNCEAWRDLSGWEHPNLCSIFSLIISQPIAMIKINEGLRSGEIRINNFVPAERRETVGVKSSIGISDVDAHIFECLGAIPESTIPRRLKSLPAFLGRIALNRLAEIISADACAMEYMVPSALKSAAMFTRSMSPQSCPVVCYHLVSLMKQVYDEECIVENGEDISIFSLTNFMIETGVLSADMNSICESLISSGIRIDPSAREVFSQDISEIQRKLLSRHLDQALPLVREIEIPHLLRAARKWGIPYLELVELAKPLTKFGVRMKDCNFDADAVQISDKQIKLLTRDLDGYFPYVDKVSTFQLAKAAKYWRTSISDVYAMVENFKEIGIDVPSKCEIMETYPLNDEEMEVLSWVQNGQPPFVSSLSFFDVMARARNLGIDFDRAREIFSSLSRFGIGVPEFQGLHYPTKMALSLLSVYGDGSAPWNTTMFIPALIKSAKKNRFTTQEVVNHINSVLAFFPNFRKKISEVKEFTPELEEIVCHAYFETSNGPCNLSVWDFALASHKLNVPVSSLIGELDKLEALGIGNIDECRAFAEYCREREAGAASGPGAGRSVRPH